MGRIWLAIRVFFLVLFNREVAAKVARALGEAAPNGAEAASSPAPAPVQPKEPPRPKAPARSPALTLLAALQREARFVDFLQESIQDYSDAQVGAVVRDIHRDCRAVVARMFAIKPVVDSGEGTSIEVPLGFDAARYRLVGNVSGQPPYQGTVAHQGWEATTCELPSWTGSAAAAMVVAPAEVELK